MISIYVLTSSHMLINALVFSNVKRGKKKNLNGAIFSIWMATVQQVSRPFRGRCGLPSVPQPALEILEISAPHPPRPSQRVAGRWDWQGWHSPGAVLGPVVWRLTGQRWKLSALLKCMSMKCSKKGWAGKSVWSTASLGNDYSSLSPFKKQNKQKMKTS